jgi:hypothetical protein
MKQRRHQDPENVCGRRAHQSWVVPATYLEKRITYKDNAHKQMTYRWDRYVSNPSGETTLTVTVSWEDSLVFSDLSEPNTG